MVINEDDYLMISGIQHFSFCKRQWALIHIEDQWDENSLTVEGEIMHERVHDPTLHNNRNGVRILRGLRVCSHSLGITGTCDLVELIPQEGGIRFENYPGTWRINPVEYKRGMKKVNDYDRLQLTAQCLCLEEMLGCCIEEGMIYYGQTRRRERVLISEELRSKTKDVINEMHHFMQTGNTPAGKRSKRCNRCSLFNLCVPQLFSDRKSRRVESYIKGHLFQEEDL